MDIKITNDNYENYLGFKSCAMINAHDDDFTIIFQSKDKVENILNNRDGDEYIELKSDKEIALPLLIINYEDIIKSSIPNCRILYNNELNIETLLSGYLIGKIFRKENINDLSELLNSNIDNILNDKELQSDLKPLIEEAEFADDFDFSKIEDQMFDIINNKIISLK
ncbi:MAG: hypothetical protein MJ245_00055 [Clostridia bacterium]|nr:hypothetical protein [Clostridia bacterium]